MAETSPVEQRLSQARTFLTFVWRRFNEDRCLMVAASLSYTSLLALVPLMAIGFAVLSAFPVFEQVQTQLQRFVFANFLPEAVDEVERYLNEFVGKARGLTAIGVIGLAATSLLLFSTIEAAVDAIFRVSKPRPLAQRLLVFWAILSLGPLLMGASFSIGTYLYAYTESLEVEAVSGPMAVLVTALPTTLAIVAFALFYLILPNRPVKAMHALVGAIVAGLAFTALRYGFTVYLGYSASYTTLYGALAIVPIFLMWMYLSWAVVLTGAVITAALPTWRRPGSLDATILSPGERLALALDLLAVLFGAAQGGGGVRRRQLIGAATAADAAVDEMLATLRKARFADLTASGRWLLARDLAATTLYDLHLALGIEVRLPDLPAQAGGSPWRRRVASILHAEDEHRQAAMDVSLRDLLVAPDDRTRGAAAAPVSVRRSS